VPLIGWVAEDDDIRDADIAGQNLMEIPPCPAIEAVRAAITGFVN
jgi:hypothetical protein